MKPFAFLLLLACGAPPNSAPEGLRLVQGRYLSDAYVAQGSREGKCDWLPSEYHDWANVDAHGAIGNLLPGTSDCSTSYANGLEFTCKGLGSTLEARGEVWSDGGAAEGIGTIHGDIGGCKRLVFGWLLVLERDGGP